jgi:hypothetical protein
MIMFTRTKEEEAERLRSLSPILLLGFIVLFAIAFQANAVITDINIIPITPTLIDPITIVVNGWESTGPVNIVDTTVGFSNNIINFDLYIPAGALSEVTPWSHSEEIGLLSPGLYELNVQTWRTSGGNWFLSDSDSLTFEVIPEPATFFILCAGIPTLRILTRSKK